VNLLEKDPTVSANHHTTGLFRKINKNMYELEINKIIAKATHKLIGAFENSDETKEFNICSRTVN